ncbi:IS200/IS605 family transposase [bacterium]|nr:IS200/IS605 family transposase [bacterium]
MSKGSHAHHEIFLHINWHCYRDQPQLTPSVQSKVFAFIKNYCLNYPGIYLKEIGDTRDHIHTAIEIEPTIVIEEMIGKIKGACAREMNKQFGLKMIRWQRGYGVVSFAFQNLPAILKYIDLQEQHHAHGTIREKLEACGMMEKEDEAEKEDEETHQNDENG